MLTGLLSGSALWYLSRATGVVSVVLLTAVVVLGVVTAGRRSPHGTHATVVMALHRWLSLGMSAFLVAHILTAILDGYVDISLVAALVPFTSGYETLWVGIGTLAVDLLLAVVATSLLRSRISEGAWRFVHWFAYAMWPLAVLHGVMMGSADAPLLRYTTLACGVVGILATGWRVSSTSADRAQRRLVDAQGWT